MKRTVQHILGAAVALAITASGAFAATSIPITQLPATISAAGNYVLQLPAGAPGTTAQSAIYGLPAIWITASDVNLDLGSQTIECSGDGILVGPQPGVAAPVVDHVTITNGTVDSTFDGKSTAYYYGLIVGYGSYRVSVTGVSFTGGFGYNADYGAFTSLTSCTFSAPLNIGSQGYQNPGHGTYSNLTVSSNFWSVIWTAPYADSALAVTLGGNNHFTNITVVAGDGVAGNIELSPTDLYKNVTLPANSTITGGTKQGN
jgi:hypothetical protein